MNIKAELLICLLASSTLIAVPAHGQGLEDKRQGRQLAERLCVNCHNVGSTSDGTSAEVAPSFKDLANRPDQTRERLAGRIVIPHPEMPTIPLTRAEIRDIVAYIISLKEDPTGP